MTVDVDLKADPEPAGLFEPQLIRYPALDPKSFRSVVDEFCHGPSGTSETAPS